MFGSRKKLLADGVQTQGQVIKVSAEVNPQTADPGYSATVRVKFPDGSTGEFVQGTLLGGGHLYESSVGPIMVGQVVPVRYDSKDQSKLAVDIPAMKERQNQARGAAQSALDAGFDRMGQQGDSSGQAAGLLAQLGLGGGGDLKAQILQMAAQNPGSVIDLRGSGSPTPADQAPSPDTVAQLSKLAEMKEQGLLSNEEFAAAKAKLLE